MIENLIGAGEVQISVIVPAFNEEKLLGATLSAIRQAMVAWQDRGWQSELVVCDNNSKDRTAQVAQEGGARVVFEPLNQISRARNAGAGSAKGRWLVFVDADSHPSRGLFADVATEIQRGDCLAGGCTIRLDGHYPIASLLTEGWNLLSRWRKWAAGSFIFCEASAFHAVGGFSAENMRGWDGVFAVGQNPFNQGISAHTLHQRRFVF